MKKFLICLLVLSLFSGMAFAAPAAKAPAPAAKSAATLDITSMTRNLSLAYYPGALIPGSILGSAIFVSDYGSFPNVAMFEYLLGSTYGLFSMATEMGQLGISISPTPYSYLWDVSVDSPNSVFGLHYGTKISGMPVGASLLYGTDRNDNNVLDVTADDPDISSDASQYIGARLGANVGGIDLSAGVVFNNYMETNENWSNAYNWDYWEQYSDSKLSIDLAARMALGAGFDVYAILTWLTGSEKYYYKDINPEDYLEDTYNSKLSFEAYVGKILKVGESLLFRFALGLTLDGDTDAKFKYTDYLYPWNNYNGNYSQDSESEIQLPFVVAIEGNLNETWSFNTGIRALLLRISGQKDAGNTDYYGERIREFETWNRVQVEPMLAYGIGVTGVIGDLTIDMFMNPNIFMTGPYFLSGNSSGFMNAGIALIYLWK